MKHIEYKVKVSSDGSKHWYLNNKRHREDGPAVEYSDGTKSWYLNGKRHREDGPAIEGTNGTKCWHLNGKYHREDGPAIEYSDGTKRWYLNGKLLTEKQFNKKMKKSCNNKVVEIDGIKYKLTVMED
tara:strand:- start:532 stop:912 length:381 start_codon:yes stop_codon:yes gene_type:complete